MNHEVENTAYSISLFVLFVRFMVKVKLFIGFVN